MHVTISLVLYGQNIENFNYIVKFGMLQVEQLCMSKTQWNSYYIIEFNMLEV
jgi:hypothetical protein